MYVYSERFEPVPMWRGVIERQAELFQRIAHKIFWPAEGYEAVFDEDGLGIWIGVYSTERPEPLLRSIQKEAFPSFAFLGVRFDGEKYWTHFRALPVF